MNSPTYLGVITQKELDQLRGVTRNGLPHPVIANNTLSDQVSSNTELAAKRIAQKDQSLLSGLRPRLLDSTDFTNASSALGEIRSYGALLETGMKVNPRPSVPGRKVVPEFEVNCSDGEVIVEAHSRQLDKEQLQFIGEHSAYLKAKHHAAVQKEKASKSGKNVVTGSLGGQA